MSAPGSVFAIKELAYSTSRAVRRVEVVRTAPGHFTVEIYLTRWTWLALGFPFAVIR